MAMARASPAACIEHTAAEHRGQDVGQRWLAAGGASAAKLTLTPAFLMELDRLIIDRNPGDYHPIQSKEIGGHSYRIGGCSALLAAGAPMLVIQAMGRWSSDCFLLYCRQGKRQKDFWMRKMLSAGDEEVSAVYDENSA